MRWRLLACAGHPAKDPPGAISRLGSEGTVRAPGPVESGGLLAVHADCGGFAAPAAPEGGAATPLLTYCRVWVIPKCSLTGARTNKPQMGRWEWSLGGFRRKAGRRFPEHAEGWTAVQTRKFTLFPEYLVRPPEDCFGCINTSNFGIDRKSLLLLISWGYVYMIQTIELSVYFHVKIHLFR